MKVGSPGSTQPEDALELKEIIGMPQKGRQQLEISSFQLLKKADLRGGSTMARAEKVAQKSRGGQGQWSQNASEPGQGGTYPRGK